MICCLPSTPGIRLGQADRLDDLLRLALVDRALEGAGREQAGAHELLGDRRAAAVVAVDGVDRGRDEARRVEARVVPERLVLDGRRRVDERGRDLVERHDIAAVVTELREEDLAGPVVDRGLRGEVQLVERGLRILEVLREVRVPGDRGERTGRAQQKQDCEQQEGKGNSHDLRGAASAGAALVTETATALPPDEARLHYGRKDTMQGMNARSSRPSREQDGLAPAAVTRA